MGAGIKRFEISGIMLTRKREIAGSTHNPTYSASRDQM